MENVGPSRDARSYRTQAIRSCSPLALIWKSSFPVGLSVYGGSPLKHSPQRLTFPVVPHFGAIVAVLHVFFAVSDMLADLAMVSSRHLEDMFDG